MRERAEEKELRRAHQNQQMQSRVQEDAEILAARERDAMREREFKQRSRRLSTASRPGSEGLGTVAGAGVYGDAPRQGSGIYDTGRDRERGVYGALGPDVERDLEQRMGDMRVGGGGPGSRLTADYGAPPPLGGPPVGVRSRRSSMSMMPVPTVGGSPLPGAAVPPGGVMMPGPGARVGKMGYDDAEYVDRDYDRDDYPLGPATTNSRRASMHMGGGGGGLGGRGGPSPYRSTSPLPPVMGPGGVPVYPPGHIYEGEPVQGGASGIISRSHSPVPGTAPYPSSMSNPGAVAFAGGGGASGGYGVVPRTPRTPRHDFDAGDQELLATPEAFSRPINRAQTFTPFEMMKIQDLDDFLRNIPRLPVVLTTHDVYAEEWGRLMGVSDLSLHICVANSVTHVARPQDLSLAWQNHLPLPSNLRSGKMPKRTTVVSDLLDSWNAAFFLPRGIEVVLYKGRERLSGRGAGRPETRLPRMDSEDSYSSDDSSDDDLYSDMEPAGGQGGRYGSGHYGLYGRRDERYEQEMRESRLYRRQKKEEKRRRAKERKMHRKEQNKTYSLYMCYVDPSARDPYGRVGGGGSNFGGSQVGGYAGSGYASSGHGL
ncbi:hypothetical protein SCHPADRAFT_248452 [Schizopora paradoxa]|uniref:Uncharacterized protein n=1 Tax=Schizopora paradoxa TaxID=27342 RepID=A0A0H2RV72_9AGAM|nr:hypothetical protein SCHPADRAFT_248452 [Schizopora paradoxa]